MKKLTFVATTAFGLEAVAAGELKDLGYEHVKTENGRVLVEGTPKDIPILNLWLRTADRVYIQLSSFKALTFTELFDQVTAYPWEDLLPEDAIFPVYAKSVKSTLFSKSDIQSIGKKAIVKRLAKVYNKEWLPETGATFPITLAFLKDQVSVLLDTSGDGLHKRGYRKEANEAPMKETLGAALVLLSRWKPHIPLVDPLCGSGTILIEAALIGRNIAPGLQRRFISEQWPLSPRSDWQLARTKALAAIDKNLHLQLEGYDLDKEAISIALSNAQKAGVGDDIHFQVRDVKDFSTKKKYGYIISNPPYGERLSEQGQVEKLYRAMGEVMIPLTTWSKYIITSFETFEKAFGQQATKNRKLYNGRIKTYFYQYYGERPPRRK